MIRASNMFSPVVLKSRLCYLLFILYNFKPSKSNALLKSVTSPEVVIELSLTMNQLNARQVLDKYNNLRIRDQLDVTIY